MELRQAEIEHLGFPARRDDHIRRFDIPMNDAFGMGRLQRIGNVHGVLHGILDRRRHAWRPPFDVLHDKIIRPDIVERADVRMIQSGDGAGLALETFSELRGGSFDGYVAAEAAVTCTIHLAHASRADRGKDFVRTELGTGS